MGIPEDMAVPIHEFPEFHLGDRIRKARELKGYNRQDFAKLIGVDRGTLTKYETTGEEPRPYILAAIAAATDFTVAQLKGEPEGSPDGGGVTDLASRRTPRINGESSSACTRSPLALVA